MLAMLKEAAGAAGAGRCRAGTAGGGAARTAADQALRPQCRGQCSHHGAEGDAAGERSAKFGSEPSDDPSIEAATPTINGHHGLQLVKQPGPFPAIQIRRFRKLTAAFEDSDVVPNSPAPLLTDRFEPCLEHRLLKCSQDAPSVRFALSAIDDMASMDQPATRCQRRGGEMQSQKLHGSSSSAPMRNTI